LKPSSQPSSVPSTSPTSIPTSQPTIFLFNLGNGIHEKDLVFILLSTGLITCITVTFTLFVITFDKSAKKYTKLFIILQNLLISGLLIAVIALINVIASNIIQNIKNYKLEYYFCFFEFTTRKYYYQSSFLWTSLLAIHFLQTTIRNVETQWIDKDIKTISFRRSIVFFLFKIYEYPSYIFWLIAFIPVLPGLCYDIYSFATIDGNYNAQTLPYSFSYAVLRVPNNLQIICTSNPTTKMGRFLDIMFFELIIALTLTFNTVIYTYSSYKIWVKSPSSVVERLMKKSAGYLIVQIIVWLPSFISNVVHIAKGSPTGVEKGLKTVLALNNLQGFLNCMIYIYTDRMFRKWINTAIKTMFDKKDIKDIKNTTENSMEIGMRETFSSETESVADSNASNATSSAQVVKSILWDGSNRGSNYDFDNKKFVKFNSRPEVRYIGEISRGSRLTESLLRIDRLSTEEKNS